MLFELYELMKNKEKDLRLKSTKYFFYLIQLHK